ncbi:hypothetical protein [Sphaerisporangium fuscum]|uniref:hypothetical protein n=1 Tax=Sphaerisporangium fuscum TaxID=2835868 RepID=UPI001BDD4476|nr:hypothetical protein [Sphaerisporangium fuscum]
MFEYLLILLVAGLPACIALVGGSPRFRSIVGAINLGLAFIMVSVTAMQLAHDPPVSTAMASGFMSVVLAVTAVVLRLSPDTAGNKEAAQVARPPYPAPSQQGAGHGGVPGVAPAHPGMPAQGAPLPQRPWPSSGR